MAKLYPKLPSPSCDTSGVNFTNILLAAFAPVGSCQSYWCTAQDVQHRSWAYFLAFCNGKVGHNYVGETEWHRRLTARIKK